MRFLEQKARLRKQRSFWSKVTWILMLATILLLIYQFYLINPTIEKKTERTVSIGLRVPPPELDQLSDR